MKKAFNGFWARFCYAFVSEPKADMNQDISRMSAYITKNYTPAQRVILAKGVMDNLIADMERTRREGAEAERAMKEIAKSNRREQKVTTK